MAEKLWKLEKSQDKDKIYSPIVNIRSKIKSSCGINIDLGKQVDTAESELTK
ncbi:hypothetical protein DB44_CW00490 [Candidatus Protochlamydia amoebophila]|uniref:Uncharacterized protein n=1 Tax=Candidatus Protochlamydia amoebophila TaxID=362787 RepID=A0A0C1JMT3_9BACT|nr:hypothetical protein DB44_CW00490 [Candidatus Protochlamydia amoebophila]